MVIVMLTLFYIFSFQFKCYKIFNYKTLLKAVEAIAELTALCGGTAISEFSCLRSSSDIPKLHTLRVLSYISLLLNSNPKRINQT